MTERKVLIEVTELKQGGFKATTLEKTGSAEDVFKGDDIYAERITLSKTGLSGRLHKRLIEIFKPG